MINEAKKLRFELDVLKEKMGAQNDPAFNALDEKKIINLDEDDAEEPNKDNKVNPSINVDVERSTDKLAGDENVIENL